MKSFFMKSIILVFFMVLNGFIIAQQNKRFCFAIAANISNPHQLFEGQNNITTFNTIKPWGNIYGAIIYRNKYQLSLGNELNETSTGYYTNDLFLNARFYFLRDTIKIKPYFETGLVLNTFGFNEFTVINKYSYQFSIGFICNLSKGVLFDFGISQQFREVELTSKASWNKDIQNIVIERFMVKTGLIFKIL